MSKHNDLEERIRFLEDMAREATAHYVAERSNLVDQVNALTEALRIARANLHPIPEALAKQEEAPSTPT